MSDVRVEWKGYLHPEDGRACYPLGLLNTIVRLVLEADLTPQEIP